MKSAQRLFLATGMGVFSRPSWAFTSSSAISCRLRRWSSSRPVRAARSPRATRLARVRQGAWCSRGTECSWVPGFLFPHGARRGYSRARAARVPVARDTRSWKAFPLSRAPVQPGPGELPVALHRALGQVQDLGDLRRAEPAEETHGHDLRLARILTRQRLQRFVDDQLATAGSRAAELFGHRRIGPDSGGCLILALARSRRRTDLAGSCAGNPGYHVGPAPRSRKSSMGPSSATAPPPGGSFASGARVLPVASPSPTRSSSGARSR